MVHFLKSLIEYLGLSVTLPSIVSVVSSFAMLPLLTSKFLLHLLTDWKLLLILMTAKLLLLLAKLLFEGLPSVRFVADDDLTEL